MTVGFLVLVVFLILQLWLGIKKAFFLFVVYYFLDYGLIMVRGLTYKDFLLAYYLLYGLVCFRKRKQDYPLKVVTLLTIGIYILSDFFNGFKKPTSFIITMFDYFALPYVIYLYIRSLRDVLFLVRCLLFLFGIVCIYSFIEQLFGYSPVVSYINIVNGDKFGVLDDSFRWGIKSTQAFFIHATTCGYFCVTSLAFVLLFQKKIINYISVGNYQYWTLVFLLTITTFLSGSRASIAALFLLYVMFPFFSYRSRQNKLKALIGILFILLVFFLLFQNYLGEVVHSILHSNESDVGSSENMRIGQYLVALSYWQKSPLIGNGSGTTGMLIGNGSGIFGAESVWIGLLIDYGVIGVFAYLCSYYSCYKLLKEKITGLLFMGIFLFVNTMTSVPGIYMSYIFMYVVVLRNLDYHINVFELKKRRKGYERIGIDNYSML